MSKKSKPCRCKNCIWNRTHIGTHLTDMKPCKNHIVVKAKQPRNPYALSAKSRRAEKFKDKRTGRGGSKNKQREYKEEE